MKQLDYSYWAEYIYDLIDVYPIAKNNVLEVGAGNGNLSKYLKGRFNNFFISDLSFNMLSKSNNGLNRCVCNMSSLPFKKEFDVIFSIFDSVNYLTTPELFVEFLVECKAVLGSKSILAFDVSLEKNSLVNLKQLNRRGRYRGVKYKQTSLFEPDKFFHKNILEIEVDNKTYIETHLQKIYRFEEYFEFAEEAGYRVLDAMNCFTFDDADEDSERVQFVLEKI